MPKSFPFAPRTAAPMCNNDVGVVTLLKNTRFARINKFPKKFEVRVSGIWTSHNTNIKYASA